MAADWVKIRNKYINSNLSVREIAKIYGLNQTTVALRCADENWVELRKQQSRKIETKINQKTAEKIAEKEADNVATVRDINANLLQAVLLASQELSKTTLRNKRQQKKVKYFKNGERQEMVDTKEYLETVDSPINIERVKDISTALRNIMEIDALTGGGGASASKAFDDLIAAIGGTNAIN